MTDSWAPTLKIETPQDGFELANNLVRLGVMLTQPSAEIRDMLRPIYDLDSGPSQVTAIHFLAVSAANNDW